MNFYRMMCLIGCGVFALVCGCAHQSPQAKSVARASDYVEFALEESVRFVHNNPMVFLTRENPSTCEPELKYELEVYGEWRHVMIVGESSQWEAFKKKAMEVPSGMPFEGLYLISQEIFVGQCGQKYYMFQIAP